MAASSSEISTSTARLREIADWLVIAIAVVLPWSTSAVSILVVIWLLCLVPTLRLEEVRRELLWPFGSLPVLLFVLGALGMLWADVSWSARFGGLSGFAKLAVIPLVTLQFSRSKRGEIVWWAFLGACCLLLIGSFVVTIWPSFPHASLDRGVIVKAYILQSVEFTICVAALLDLAIQAFNTGRLRLGSALSLLALAFLADIFFIITGRTALVVMAVLVVVYGLKHSGWIGALVALLLGTIAAGLVWTSSPYLRHRVSGIYTESAASLEQGKVTSAGERIAFWTRSLEFIRSAPVLGHGTGSITEMFRNAAKGQKGSLGVVSSNPHNQTFAVGIQIGLVGVAVLWLMWVVHLTFFWRGTGFVAWLGLIVAIQNIVGSLFNSFIFDFTEGWMYVLGIGVLAGMLRQQSYESSHRLLSVRGGGA